MLVTPVNYPRTGVQETPVRMGVHVPTLSPEAFVVTAQKVFIKSEVSQEDSTRPLSYWYPGSSGCLIVSIPDICPLSYFYLGE